ncbi:neuromedin-U isoform X3 [Ascaphus truei]|uniref:neuromedin-U isoform X3 n=1 Tax=Ascaphus truei TaxID=8439 RepID=UPI003F59C0D2
MLSASGCQKQTLHATKGRPQSSHQHSFRRQPHCWYPGNPLLLLLILLASWTHTCKGAPLSSKALRAEQELQLWNGIDDACSAILSDSQPVASSALEELCFMVMGILQKSQGSDEKETTKRSSVLHPLLQLVPQLHDRRMKRFKADEEVQGPGGVLSRGYFLFRPRNGRRAAGFR